MLNKVERKILDYLFVTCRGKQTVLVSPPAILKSIAPKFELTAKQLELAIKNIALDGYIDVTRGDRGGSCVYVVTLRQRGEAWQREKDESRSRVVRSLGWKLMLTIGGFILTTILWAIFRR